MRSWRGRGRRAGDGGQRRRFSRPGGADWGIMDARCKVAVGLSRRRAAQWNDEIDGTNETEHRGGSLMAGQVGDIAPDFTLPSPHHGDIALSSYRGERSVVLSFHVLDFTGG